MTKESDFSVEEINRGPPCPYCGSNDWRPTPDADSKIICKTCDYAADEVFPPNANS